MYGGSSTNVIYMGARPTNSYMEARPYVRVDDWVACPPSLDFRSAEVFGRVTGGSWKGRGEVDFGVRVITGNKGAKIL